MKYICLSQQVYESGFYTIRPLNSEDMEPIRLWRNDQMQVLRQKEKISEEQQISYFNQVVSKLFHQHKPTQILFAYLNKNILIGYGGLVHISWEDYRAEMSFLVATERTKDAKIYEEDMTNFIKLIKGVCFQNLHFNRLFTETYAFREAHISILEKCGFVYEGKLRSHIMENGIFVDALLHGILEHEYNESR